MDLFIVHICFLLFGVLSSFVSFVLFCFCLVVFLMLIYGLLGVISFDGS